MAGGAADIAIGWGGGGAIAEAAADIAMGWGGGGTGAGAAIAPG
ncbi:MAG TPA: hypothetical protein VF938_06825 [Candidatus Angelobacter sp.]